MTKRDARTLSAEPAEKTASSPTAASAATTARLSLASSGRAPWVKEAAALAGNRSRFGLPQLYLIGGAVGVGHHHRIGLPIPFGSVGAPAIGLDGDDLVRPEVDDCRIDKLLVGALSQIAGVVAKQADAGQRILHLAPFDDLGLAGAEHLELGAQLLVLWIGCNVAPGRRLGHDPVGHRRRQGQPLLIRHVLAELLERIPTLALEGILGERCLIVCNRVRGLTGGLIEVAA